MNNNKVNVSLNRKKGLLSEKIAINYLQSLNYKILKTNYYFSKYSEIDIIAEDNDCIVFVEVKARKNTNCGHPLESVSKNKLLKIYLAIENYLNVENKVNCNYRIDVISIVGFVNPVIQHVKNISVD